MKKSPVVTGGNTEAATAARALLRYMKEDKQQNQVSDKDAAMDTFIFAAGVVSTFGVSVPQMMLCLLLLGWNMLKAKFKR